MFRVLLISALVVITTSDADAGWLFNRRNRRTAEVCCQPVAATACCEQATIACCGNIDPRTLPTGTVEPIPAPARTMPSGPAAIPQPQSGQPQPLPSGVPPVKNFDR